MVKLLRYLSVYLVCLARLVSIGITVHSMSVSTSVHVSLPSFHQLFSHVHGLIILHHLMRTLTQDSANLDAGMHGFVAVHVILHEWLCTRLLHLQPKPAKVPTLLTLHLDELQPVTPLLD